MGFTTAVGKPASTERASQFDLAAAKWISLENRNVLNISANSPPRYYDQTLDQWKTWWLRVKEGHNLHLSSYAYNGHSTRYMTPGQKKVYAKRLLSGNRPNYRPLAWYSDSADRSKVLLRLATADYFDNSFRKHDYRIVTCQVCDGYAIGDHNVKHRCISEDTTPEEAKAMKAVATNLQYVSLVYPHDFIDHTIYGRASWKECNEDPLGLEAGLTNYLDDLGLVQQDALAVLREQWDQVRSFIPALPDFELGLVTYQKKGYKSAHVLAMAVDRYLQARACQNPPLGGPLPSDSIYDDEAAYGSQVTTIVKFMTKSNKHMVIVKCSHQPSYGYSAVRPASGVRQHDCPEMYGPLLAASGLRYVRSFRDRPLLTVMQPFRSQTRSRRGWHH